MNKAADLAEEKRDGGTVIRLSGNLAIACLHDLPDRLDGLQGPVSAIDLSGVDHIDTIGAWTVLRTAKRLGAEVTGAHDDARRLIDTVGQLDEPVPIRPEHVHALRRVVGQIGEAVANSGATLLGLLGFFGATLVASWSLIRHPRRFRWNAVIQRFEVVGVSALGIIGLMSFLIGIVIAQQGSVQLRQFGMEMLTINLVGRLTFRELGVLMTAIMVAGRSGSAFAAQLGTMKLTEEIDAMRTIGVSPMEALVLPRTLAVVVMMPLLGFYSSIVAIIGGGFLCAVALEIPPITFVQRLREVVPITDLWVGLIKAPVFGIIIALSGCFQGMQVKANAEEVGMRTTAAVVQAIFLVIVIDAFFAVFFTWVGWN
ncbi:MAG TPA: ABC transporter permease [Sphingobium sp.]|jgi:phospholipid/cholesterol/gamma-HCH transport system permease protein|uniref:ABC transporter permease n=1 Tax=unclassified Sphingobium TaxID=2611147 RepID=UPI0007F46517|nr:MULTISPECIES: MlaE family lipid ABC transporter permease subunit [unclassified Sphingobium]OAN50939.1 ABC transporter permease [Sphingobium sp. TCM1]WIW87987.1 MlaE family lipid ABC transporter permease subunit [Sphingobium sp. V4]HAF41120.1 ABC transporter permease [Sphingobium sp.]